MGFILKQRFLRRCRGAPVCAPSEHHTVWFLRREDSSEETKLRSPENGFHIKTTFFYTGVGAHPCVRPRNITPFDFCAEKIARRKTKLRSPENGFHIKTTFFYAGVGAHPCVRPQNITPFDFCAEKKARRKLNLGHPKIGFILKQRFFTPV